MTLYLNTFPENFTSFNTTGTSNISINSISRNRFDAGFSDQSSNSSIPSINNDMLVSTALPQTSNSFAPSKPDYDRQNIKIFQFAVWGILGSVLAVLGFMGNMLSVIVLQRRQMRSSTSYYLLSLAIYDNGILIGMLVYFCLPALAPYMPCLSDYQTVSVMTIPVGYPLSLAAQMGSIYTCVGFTVERFIAVCRPLHAANTCTKSRTVRAITLIFVWSIIYNIPRFFHYKVHYDDADTETNLFSDNSLCSKNVSTVAFNCTQKSLNAMPSSCVLMNSSYMELGQMPVQSPANPQNASHNELFHSTQWLTTQTPPASRQIRYKETEFGADPTFQHLYLIYSQLFFMFLLPFLIILIMNVGLIKAVKSSKSMQQSMCASARKEHNLTVMLIAVIVVFLVCQFPTIIDNILVAVIGEATLKKKFAYMCFWIVCTFMVEINAASNFLLYCFFGKKFRMMLLNILGLKRKQRQVAYRSTVCKSRTNGTRTYEMEVSVM